jgi:hypothetical protein
LSLEREPSYFAAAAVEGADHRTIVATEDGRVVCAGSVSSRLRYVNGEPMRVGYLGGLRLDSTARGRTSILLRGYALFRQLHEQLGGPPIYLTSIAADNVSARRVLEKGLSGMPTYHPLGEVVTLIIRCRRASPAGQTFLSALETLPDADATDRATLCRFINRSHSAFQFAPVWSGGDLRGDAFATVRDASGTPTATAAVWDQRALKQTVVRGYSPTLRRLRPLINLAATVLRRARLPAVGSAIANAHVSHLAAADPSRADTVIDLVRRLYAPARARGVDYLTLGLDARDPRLPRLRQTFHPREYVTRLYAVHWNDGAALARRIDPNRLLAPEVATL